MQEPVPGISAVPDDVNARYFHVVVAGPEESPFEGGVFKLKEKWSPYRFLPPTMLISTSR